VLFKIVLTKSSSQRKASVEDFLHRHIHTNLYTTLNLYIYTVEN